MYITRSTLLLMVFSYLIFLLSVDWLAQPEGAWYRPFIVGLLVIGIAALCHREHTDDI